ncbi:branched-chain amino acid ABC transporter permease [Microbacterium sp. No. 7]|uniref:branched-chain amino acid ABC transporter permease n=1 Tax=Microbacterium sp. No. 7 TaxID=1714373 RepID=UPI0006D2143D|nr:branched-chain amino acid ABC transporter permease [Microbacterium sp. No. 7]ALJ21796.1 branched-chain amino acid ABC transporter permease [Microbacterium sp. No. 7]
MRLVQLLILGLSLGAIYGLIALSFVTIFKGTRVFNLAQGGVMLLGVYVTAQLSGPLGFWAAATVGIASAGLLAVILQRIVALAPRGDHLVLTILTVGLEVILAAELARLIGTRILTVGDPWGDRTISVFGATVPVARVAALIVCVVLIALFFLVFRRTRFGIRMRASAADPETAALMGISQRQVAMVSWLIGGALAAVAGLFLAMFPNPGLEHSAHLLAFNAIPAVIIGGLDSSEGAILGGLIVGVSQTLVTGYASSLGFLGEGIGDVTPYIVMIVFLLVRPSGLFGTKERLRV